MNNVPIETSTDIVQGKYCWYEQGSCTQCFEPIFDRGNDCEYLLYLSQKAVADLGSSSLAMH